MRRWRFSTSDRGCLYGSGQSVISYASGYVSRRDVWVLGFVMGTIFISVHLLAITRWLAFLEI